MKGKSIILADKSKAIKQKNGKSRVRSIILNTLLMVFCAIHLFPIYIIVANSFKSPAEIFENMLALPTSFSIENYVEAWERMNFMNALLNSFIVTSISIIFIVVLASMTGWMLVRSNNVISKIIFSVLVATMLIPFQALMMPLTVTMGWIRDGLGIATFNSLGSLIFMNIGFGASLAVFLFHGFIGSIPLSLEEAATIDGCSRWGMFWRIVFPMLKPVTVTVVILNVIWLWNDFLLPSLFLLDRNVRTIPLSTFSFFGIFTTEWNMAMAALTLTIIPVILFYLFAQKHIIKGVAAGAVK
jgi:raffinose/stachyose/melibiose transport system permease protein